MSYGRSLCIVLLAVVRAPNVNVYQARVMSPVRIEDAVATTLRVQHAHTDSGATVLIAVLDNLGKGASGAAVQNLNLLLGRDEALGL